MVDGGVRGDLDPAHFHVVLIARLDLHCAVPEERELPGVTNIHLERIPVRVDGGWAGDVGVAVQDNFEAHVKTDLSLENFSSVS